MSLGRSAHLRCDLGLVASVQETASHRRLRWYSLRCYATARVRSGPSRYCAPGCGPARDAVPVAGSTRCLRTRRESGRALGGTRDLLLDAGHGPPGPDVKGRIFTCPAADSAHADRRCASRNFSGHRPDRDRGELSDPPRKRRTDIDSRSSACEVKEDGRGAKLTRA